MIYRNDNIHDGLEKIAVSSSVKLKQDAEAYFKFMTVSDAIQQRSGVMSVLKRNRKLAKKGGIRGWFAKKSLPRLQKDVNSFNRMISYGKKHGYK